MFLSEFLSVRPPLGRCRCSACDVVFFPDSLVLSLTKHLSLRFDLFSTLDLLESSESPSLTNVLRCLSAGVRSYWRKMMTKLDCFLL